jgi:hypothetical protein
MRRFFFAPTLLLFGLAAPAGALAASRLDISCAMRAVEVCASFDGRFVWFTRNGGLTWRPLADLTAAGEDDSILDLRDDDLSGAERDLWTLDEETWIEEDLAEDSEMYLDGEVAALEVGPQEESPASGHSLCVSDGGVVALATGSRIRLFVGARERLIRLPAQMRSCVFEGEEILWLSGPEATIRMHVVSGSWDFAQIMPALSRASGHRGVLGPFRSSARREFRSCPVRAAAFLPRVRWMFAWQRYSGHGFAEAEGTTLTKKQWGVDVAVWLDFRLPGLGSPLCSVESSLGERSVQQSWERPGPYSPPKDSSLVQALDFWERVEARRALSVALGE